MKTKKIKEQLASRDREIAELVKQRNELLYFLDDQKLLDADKTINNLDKKRIEARK